jgi:hypothetical protein
MTTILVLVSVAFSYWIYTKRQCNELVRQKLVEMEDVSISEGKQFYELAYKICMGKRGF